MVCQVVFQCCTVVSPKIYSGMQDMLNGTGSIPAAMGEAIKLNGGG
jgi:hypothetical protein